MTVPASIYDPAWRYIETDERPETGIIQKVQYTDDPTYGNDDTVTISGFFLESIMNRRTFLDETPEEVTRRYYVHPPEPPQTEASIRDVYKDATGKYWYVTPSGKTYGVTEGTPTDSDARTPGSEVKTDESGQAYIETGSGRVDVSKEVVYKSLNSYYYNDGSTTQVHQVYYSMDDEGVIQGTSDVTHDIAFDDGFGITYFNSGGRLYAATGVTKKEGEQFIVQKSEWRRGTDMGWVEYTETVAGPWQITDVADVTTEQDNVQRVWDWARTMFQNQMLFVVPTITGESKIIDPSFKLLGDMMYEELKTVGASFRVEYDFQNNQFTFRVWRGLDRTQGTNSPEEASAKALAAPVMRAAAQRNAGLPAGYTEVEYIEASGTQFIDTGFVANQDTKIIVSYNATAEGFVFGGEVGWGNGSFDVHTRGVAYGNESVNPVNVFNTDIVTTLDKNVFSNTAGQSHTFGAGKTFSTQYTVCLFTTNRSGNNQEFMSGRIHYCKVYDNGTLARDFVPCKRDNDGSIGLYDLVGGHFYGNAGTGTFIAGSVVPIDDELAYMPGDDRATGVTPPTEGIEGQQVTVAQCGFRLENGTFLGWSTLPEGGGTVYQPGDKYTLTAGDDVLYAWWKVESPIAGDKAPWAVFSDTWGTLYGYEAQRDDSNYRNTCHVLYEYDKPKGFDENGAPALRKGFGYFEYTDDGPVFNPVFTGWYIPYERNRGFLSVRLEDDYDDRETYLDLRDDKPECDQDWPRAVYAVDEYPEDSPPELPSGMKEKYDAFEASLLAQGRSKLETDYPIVTSLDTGDLRTDRYMLDYDLGDLVDMAVNRLGIVEEARITGASRRFYESGSSTVDTRDWR